MLRHAHATTCRIVIEVAPGRASVSIADDGVGGDAVPAGSPANLSTGMRGLTERVRAAGGTRDRRHRAGAGSPGVRLGTAGGGDVTNPPWIRPTHRPRHQRTRLPGRRRDPRSAEGRPRGDPAAARRGPGHDAQRARGPARPGGRPRGRRPGRHAATRSCPPSGTSARRRAARHRVARRTGAPSTSRRPFAPRLPSCARRVPHHLRPPRVPAAGVRRRSDAASSSRTDRWRSWPTSIRRVRAGERVVDPDLAAAALASGASPLTDRERDVLAASADGSTTDDIAGRGCTCRRHRAQLPVLGDRQDRHAQPDGGRRPRPAQRLALSADASGQQ